MRKKWSDRDGGPCKVCNQKLSHFREINYITNKVSYIVECRTCRKQWVRHVRDLQDIDVVRYWDRFYSEENNKFIGRPLAKV